jgi:hypothetical protein
MKEKVFKRLSISEIEDSNPACRNNKLRDAILNEINLNISSIRLVNDSANWRGWIVSYEE